MTFEQQFSSNRSEALRYALYLTRSLDDAEDVVQAAAIHGARYYNSLRDKTVFLSWLKHIVKQQYVNLIRENSASKRVPSMQQEAYDEDFVGRLHAQDLKNAILAIPEPHRQAFILHAIKGYKADEIAAATGWSPITIRTRTRRARYWLFKHYEHLLITS